jgi:hypothetical protein
MRRLHQPALLGLIALVVAGAAPHAAGAGRPVRSGTILSGFNPGLAWIGPSPRGCGMVPDCAAWLASGCRSELSGRDPGLHTSIVDVAGLGSTRRAWSFLVSPKPLPAGLPAQFFHGVSLELWSRDCHSLSAMGLDWRNPVKRVDRFLIPPRTRWMTVTSSDNTTVSWDLRPSRGSR